MGKRHVLIVDDEANLLVSLAELLRNEGFNVSCVSDGGQALSRIRQQAPDLILLDIWLPGMDGIETLQALRNMNSTIKVIVLSGHGNIETAVRATKLGAFDYLEKPCAPDVLLRTIHRALNHHHTGQRDEAISELPLPALPALIGDSPQIEALRRQLADAIACDSPVLIRGQAGSETDLVAYLLHSRSRHREGAFVTYTCDDIPARDAERLLFGAVNDRHRWSTPPTRGYVELANGGTLFLDSIEWLQPDVQRKLVHTMIDHTLQRVGGQVTIPVNIRYIASCSATPGGLHEHGPLIPELAAQFRSVHVELPPLHERKSDIPALVNHFLHILASENGGLPKEIDEQAIALLRRYDWPGDISELKQIIRYLIRHTATRCLGEQQVARALQNARGPVSDARIVTWPPNTHTRSRRSTQSNQKTLRRSMVVYGQGLQSGLKTGIILSPLPPNSGIVFRNITTGETLPASIRYVDSTDFSTSLRKGRVTARTVEHLLSALHAYRITNLLIKISDEVPIMDGSASDFCDLIEKGGLEEQDAVAEEFVVDRCYHIGDVSPGAKSITLEPYNGFRVTYRLDYPQPLGVQEVTYEHRGGASYRREVAPARTFGFVKDVETMHDLGLVAGGRLNNVILLDGEKIVNSTQLRFPDECARHKVLDIIGDLYLLGKPVRGHIRANMTGHTENVALVQKLHDAMQRGA